VALLLLRPSLPPDPTLDNGGAAERTVIGGLPELLAPCPLHWWPKPSVVCTPEVTGGGPGKDASRGALDRCCVCTTALPVDDREATGAK